MDFELQHKKATQFYNVILVWLFVNIVITVAVPIVFNDERLDFEYWLIFGLELFYVFLFACVRISLVSKKTDLKNKMLKDIEILRSQPVVTWLQER